MINTLDNLQPVDVERIFGTPETNLNEICDEVGDHTVKIWIDTGMRKARKQEITPKRLYNYMLSYIGLRYNQYKE